MIDRRWRHAPAVSFLCLILFSAGGLRAAPVRTTEVTLVRVPDGGIQPQAAVDEEGNQQPAGQCGRDLIRP